VYDEKKNDSLSREGLMDEISSDIQEVVLEP
jgi:hypothetical protein